MVIELRNLRTLHGDALLTVHQYSINLLFMTTDLNVRAFRAWLIGTKNFSSKGSGDVVSRLNRCVKLESLETHDSSDSYLDALLQNPRLDIIPQSSRNSMFRSARLYFDFIGK